MRFLLVLIIILSAGVACDSDTSGSAGMDGMTDDDGGTASMLDAAVVDRRSYLPVTDNARWLYARDGHSGDGPAATTVVRRGEGENEWVRETTTTFELEIDGTPENIRQVFSETMLIEPSMQDVGPVIKIRKIEIDESRLSDNSPLQRTERVYLPPYTLMADAWRVGLFATNTANDHSITETITRAGEDEPNVRQASVEVKVVSSTTGEVLLLNGQYRENVRKVEVSDSFLGTKNRTYWFEQGVGPVQWQFQSANNGVYTLLETSIED